MFSICEWEKENLKEGHRSTRLNTIRKKNVNILPLILMINIHWWKALLWYLVHMKSVNFYWSFIANTALPKQKVRGWRSCDGRNLSKIIQRRDMTNKEDKSKHLDQQMLDYVREMITCFRTSEFASRSANAVNA